MIRVIVSGAKGRMGTCIVDAVAGSQDMQVVGCFAPQHAGQVVSCADGDFTCSDNLAELISQTSPDVLVDFTQPDALLANAECALSRGVHVVTGTTGVGVEDMRATWQRCSAQGAKLFFAPNFTTGAVLMMQFAKVAGKFFPDVEIIEMHHDGKKDAPSGTAVQTARMIAEGREGAVNVGPGSETEIAGCEGARGCDVDGVRIHAVRGDGYMASQEVIMSAAGQTLTLRHDSTLRTAYMPGILLAVRSIAELPDGFTVGLEGLMGL
ncbi:MAG: 4-hydroxy-tetrahydrodipicolinate reductase [Coriobacteriia bacterium]|nr:4-hydroxy-tetrahydrodipicolinate reductase [Coriobacteriia bacterium]